MPALKEMPSQARVDANRRNAQLSTGPRSEAGKARSRGNAVKHGLTGAGIVLPGEDEAAVAEQFEAVVAELAPTTAAGAYFARRVAVCMVRTERAVRHEAKAISHRMRHAAEDFDQSRRDAATLLARRLADDPRATRRDLLRTPEGVDILVDNLHALRGHVARLQPDWSAERETLLLNTCGWVVDEFDPARGLALSRALLGDDCFLSDHDIEQRAACAVPQHYVALVLRALINVEIDRLTKHRATLDHAVIAQDRAEAADRALFDPGKDAQLARRYEASATRGLTQALGLLHAAETAAETGTNAEPEAHAPVESTSELINEPATIVANSATSNDLTPVLASFGGPTPTDAFPGHRFIAPARNEQDRSEIGAIDTGPKA